MMPILTMRKAAEKGGRFAIMDGRLKVSAPAPLPPDLMASIRLHKSEIMKAIDRPPPPLPKSVFACLDFLRRTHFAKPLTPKLAAWLGKDGRRIVQYENRIIGD